MWAASTAGSHWSSFMTAVCSTLSSTTRPLLEVRSVSLETRVGRARGGEGRRGPGDARLTALPALAARGGLEHPQRADFPSRWTSESTDSKRMTGCNRLLREGDWMTTDKGGSS